MQRRTKIVATLGPVSTNPEVLAKLMTAGCDVFRLNFSHGSGEKLVELANQVREIADSLGRTVGILADLQGPKIRIGKFSEGKIALKTGDKFILDAKCELGNQERVGLDYKELPNDVGPGSVLLLDDGRIVLHVDQVRGSEVYTTVESGGPLSNNKGINRRGGGLTAPPLTEKDMLDIRVAAAMKADYLAVSFPRSGSDMQFARELLRVAGGQSRLVAKIERAEAIPALDDILKASDGIMVARGDLAVEVGDAAVPGLQKKMIRAARERNRLVITATQMMESMISSPVPTRAEVSDVANAVLDGTDAVMLSAESASGRYPVEAIEDHLQHVVHSPRSLDHSEAAEEPLKRRRVVVELDRCFFRRGVVGDVHHRPDPADATGLRVAAVFQPDPLTRRRQQQRRVDLHACLCAAHVPWPDGDRPGQRSGRRVFREPHIPDLVRRCGRQRRLDR